MSKYAKCIEGTSRWGENMNFMFEWQEQCHENTKIHIFEPPCNILFIIWSPIIWHCWFYCVFKQSSFTTIRVGFIENTKYPVFSFLRLWENSFISSSICKTNLPATAMILNWKRRKKPTLYNAGKCENQDDTERHSDPGWSGDGIYELFSSQ